MTVGGLKAYCNAAENDEAGGDGKEAEDQHGALEEDVGPFVDAEDAAGSVFVQACGEEAVDAVVAEKAALFDFNLFIDFVIVMRGWEGIVEAPVFVISACRTGSAGAEEGDRVALRSLTGVSRPAWAFRFLGLLDTMVLGHVRCGHLLARMSSAFRLSSVRVHDAHEYPREGNPCEKPAHPVVDVVFV